MIQSRERAVALSDDSELPQVDLPVDPSLLTRQQVVDQTASFDGLSKQH